MEQRHPPPEGGLALPPISVKASLEKASSDKNPVYFIAHWVTPMRIQKQPVAGGELQAIQ